MQALLRSQEAVTELADTQTKLTAAHAVSRIVHLFISLPVARIRASTQQVWYARICTRLMNPKLMEDVMERNASAVWKGSLKEGKGTVSTQSGVLKETQYSFSTRFENGAGTNPEELIAAAHAGCFTMALSAQLGNANLTPESLETTAQVKFEKTDAGFTITAIHLTTRAKVPGASESAFETAAQNAKNGCPISRLFKGNTELTLDAKLVS